MRNHTPASLPREYRHYLADLFHKKGITDYTEQCLILAELLKCSGSHARCIMNGKRDLSGTRTGDGMNKYAVLAHYFSMPVDELIAMDSEYRAMRGPRRK